MEELFSTQEFCRHCELYNKATGKSIDTFHALDSCPVIGSKSSPKSLDKAIVIVQSMLDKKALKNDPKA